MNYEQKTKALAQYLNVADDCIEQADHIAGTGKGFMLENSSAEYLVLTDEEATLATRENIRESLWAFDASFILNHASKVTIRSPKAFETVTTALGKLQSDLCEDANDLVFALIEDFDAFVTEAIKADGRGHFLAGYDSEEHEVKTNAGYFYIYRVN